MLAQWEVEFFGKKRAHKVKDFEIAKELGWHPGYLSMVLNGKRTPKDAEKKLSAALDAIIARNKTNEAGA
jgi:predicted urease superfamily metal-dependent hydrolase